MSAKKAAKTGNGKETTAYSFAGEWEYDRKVLPPSEYSGTDPQELMRKKVPTAQFDLPQGADLEEEIEARNRDLDPQYVWRGKSKGNGGKLETPAPFIWQQEKIFPRLLIDDMRRRTLERKGAAAEQMEFGAEAGDFYGIPDVNFYAHTEGWKNRLILGDSLSVMASLAENEGLRGKVQMVYIDPPYGIKFNSNWQPTTKSTNVQDGKREGATREAEMIKAFRDTWHDGIHSYLGYLRDRLVAARDLLTDTGSVFVQISEENVHKVRSLLDEVFGEDNFVSQISFRKKTMPLGAKYMEQMHDFILFYAKNKAMAKYRRVLRKYLPEGEQDWKWACDDIGRYRQLSVMERNNFSCIPEGMHVYRLKHPAPIGQNESNRYCVYFEGETFKAPGHGWGMSEDKMERMIRAGRIQKKGALVNYRLFLTDSSACRVTNPWNDTCGAQDKRYVVQTSPDVIARCMLMTTDPGDLVLDPTCGSGTTAFVAEQWGRRWITVDTSRVALALARKRLMTAKFPHYLLADTEEGEKKEMEVTGKAWAIDRESLHGRVSRGFVYERVPHVTLKSIANNSEIDTIWEKYEGESARLRGKMGEAAPEEWQVPFECPAEWGGEARAAHVEYMAMRGKRQGEIDASIRRSAETEYLYDRPYEDKKKVRVAGPFTVESVSPVRALTAGADGSAGDPLEALGEGVDYGPDGKYLARMVKALRQNGVKQARREDRIEFAGVEPLGSGGWLAAEATGEAPEDGGRAKRYAIAFGPEFGTVTRLDVNRAVEEAERLGGFDALIYCGFGFEAYANDGAREGGGRKLKVLFARMNSDLHMTMDLKDGAAGNPFLIFGEPDVRVARREDGKLEVEILGVDVYDPKTGEVRSDTADAIDCWMLDTDYSGKAFFAREVYFPGGGTYDGMKKMLKGDIDEEEWESVAKTVSRGFEMPSGGKIAVKVINSFGDEVMKIFDARSELGEAGVGEE